MRAAKAGVPVAVDTKATASATPLSTASTSKTAPTFTSKASKVYNSSNKEKPTYILNERLDKKPPYPIVRHAT